jgi:predicted ABC-type ATPase
MSKPFFFIIAGPNGAGKSTSSTAILKRYGVKAFDWDAEFYSTWKRFGYDPAVENGVKDSTTEKFEEHLKKAFKEGIHVAYETNFHTDFHFKREELARKNGFETILIFFLVDNIITCNERVQERYDLGGHFVEPKTVKYRWEEGLKRLNKALTKFNQVHLFDTSEDYNIEFKVLIENQKLSMWDDKSIKELSEYIPDLKNIP